MKRYNLGPVRDFLVKQKRNQKILCGFVTFLWFVAAISMGVCFFLSLKVYPEQQLKLENFIKTYDYSWTTAVNGSQPSCKTFCGGTVTGSCPEVGQNLTTTFDLPNDWTELTTMDDVYVTLDWGTYQSTPRVFLAIYSNDVFWHFQELLDQYQWSCGVCFHTERFIQSAFHHFSTDDNRTLWQPRSVNNLVLQLTGGSACLKAVQLQIRYSTKLFSNYDGTISKIYWAAIGLR
eukprot:TRINITY_DN4845_c0_g1_i2.p1 TRINITY_DN4845_c0_g1~~TRINITY_DN4845_c0_g1_i2.p1  ORF type:complete len:233 (+),score=29.22 TRINITY_DN4845_c0_g1_i2:3-701(+)